MARFVLVLFFCAGFLDTEQLLNELRSFCIRQCIERIKYDGPGDRRDGGCDSIDLTLDCAACSQCK